MEEKSKSDLVFATIDTDRDGYVNGLECKDVFLQTGLSQNILAHIWFVELFYEIIFNI